MKITRIHRPALLLIPLVLFQMLPEPSEAQMTPSARPTTLAGRSTVYAPNGVVATSQPLATSAALKVLQDGGNSFDAAVTAAAVLNVVEPHMTGMGGDVFALFWSVREQRLRGLDASGRAGSLATPDTIRALGLDDVPYRGASAVTVPGALSGWAALLEEYGTLSLADALAPAIEIAENGFPVTPIIASQWRGTARILRRDPGASATYLIDGERSPVAGEWFQNSDLASSFRLVAQEGPGAFYGGALGARIVEEVQAQGGFLTLEDLKNHQPEWVEPISIDFHGYQVWELPPAGQGIAALEMMKILEPLDLRSMGHNSAEYLHHIVEAKKLAFADLARYISDRDHLEGNPRSLLDEEYLAGRRSLIDPQRAADRVDPGRPFDSGETIYLTVADRQGNMVSFINSVFEYFGSGVVVPGTGFVLQNRGAGFTLQDGHPNQIAPRKRPFHTLIPGFVTKDGEPLLSFGVMGGSMQPQGHTQLLLNLLVFGMDLQEAIDAPRVRHMGGTRIVLEAPISDDVRLRLWELGHTLSSGGSFGGAQAVMRLPRGWAAGSDPRKDGMAAGH
ncbi:MAG: gamma-glutamyltransferase [Gemmatimonadota bacterium]|jgi:gamma-glutamyltranspeptidase/glutathione hydrolase